ncbi:NADH dehydrogenase subunit [Candidatus Poribacteria bacterium]|nr:NADH dehydrogenase subunit [Candidatus Poribacteria bacterium]
MSIIDQVRDAGVVGAGGAGFPAHKKLEATVEVVIANGAECEPLLHKDTELIERHASEIVRAVRLVMDATKAKRGVVGLKAKHAHAVEALERARAGTPVELHQLGDYYPTGDEFVLVHAVTDRLIPAGGIPLQVGCVVHNVESLLNILRATHGEPVTRKALTVAGAVRTPMSFEAPIGVPLRDLLSAAGGATVDDYAAFVGGTMMGSITRNLDGPVTKTTGGLLVVPADHRIVQRRELPERAQRRIGKSACDQCSYCTELCPRYLLGYDVQPHKVMRGLGFTMSGSEMWSKWADLCCACGLCTQFACPEDLFPKEACDRARADRREAKLDRWLGPSPDIKPHAMAEGRHIPLKSLIRKLGLEPYDVAAPWTELDWKPSAVRIALRQHVGAPSVPVVEAGARVSRGQAIAEIPEKALGARVHSSIDGVVRSITAEHIEIVA